MNGDEAGGCEYFSFLGLWIGFLTTTAIARYKVSDDLGTHFLREKVIASAAHSAELHTEHSANTVYLNDFLNVTGG